MDASEDGSTGGLWTRCPCAGGCAGAGMGRQQCTQERGQQSFCALWCHVAHAHQLHAAGKPPPPAAAQPHICIVHAYMLMYRVARASIIKAGMHGNRLVACHQTGKLPFMTRARVFREFTGHMQGMPALHVDKHTCEHGCLHAGAIANIGSKTVERGAGARCAVLAALFRVALCAGGAR